MAVRVIAESDFLLRPGGTSRGQSRLYTKTVSADAFTARYAAAATRRSFVIKPGKIVSAFSTSAAVLKRLNEKRRLERARSSEKPIAFKTCEACTEPVVHAEPEEQQMPF